MRYPLCKWSANGVVTFYTFTITSLYYLTLVAQMQLTPSGLPRLRIVWL